MSLVPKDLTPVYKETIGKGAGARRWQRPVYVDHLPPCNHACPAGENIQAWLALAQAGDYEGAWRKYMEENPLPGTHGRACYHPCESACNRQFLDQPVSIHSLDRFLGDLANEKGWTIAPGAADRQARARGRRRPGGPVVRVSPATLRARGRDPRRQPGAGRDDALRHSRVPPAARGTGQGNRAHRGDGRDDRPQLARERRARREGGGRVRRRLPGDRRAGRQSPRYSGHGRRQDHRRRHAAGAGREGARAVARPRRRHRRRRQHRDGRRAHRQAPRRRGGGASSSASTRRRWKRTPTRRWKPSPKA